MSVCWTESEDGNTDEVQHDGRDVHHVVGPVAPAGEKTVEVPKDFLGPEVDTAFAGIAVSEFDDGNALGPEKKKKRNDPEPDRDPAVRGDGRDDVEVENGNDEEKNEVPAAEDALKVRYFARF